MDEHEVAADSIARLNDDVLRAVACHCPPASLVHARQACKAWSRTFCASHRTFVVSARGAPQVGGSGSQGGSEEALAKCLAVVPQLQHATLRSLTDTEVVFGPHLQLLADRSVARLTLERGSAHAPTLAMPPADGAGAMQWPTWPFTHGFGALRCLELCGPGGSCWSDALLRDVGQLTRLVRLSVGPVSSSQALLLSAPGCGLSAGLRCLDLRLLPPSLFGAAAAAGSAAAEKDGGVAGIGHGADGDEGMQGAADATAAALLRSLARRLPRLRCLRLQDAPNPADDPGLAGFIAAAIHHQRPDSESRGRGSAGVGAGACELGGLRRLDLDFADAVDECDYLTSARLSWIGDVGAAGAAGNSRLGCSCEDHGEWPSSGMACGLRGDGGGSGLRVELGAHVMAVSCVSDGPSSSGSGSSSSALSARSGSSTRSSNGSRGGRGAERGLGGEEAQEGSGQCGGGDDNSEDGRGTSGAGTECAAATEVTRAPGPAPGSEPAVPTAAPLIAAPCALTEDVLGALDDLFTSLGLQPPQQARQPAHNNHRPQQQQQQEPGHGEGQGDEHWAQHSHERQQNPDLQQGRVGQLKQQGDARVECRECVSGDARSSGRCTGLNAGRAVAAALAAGRRTHLHQGGAGGSVHPHSDNNNSFAAAGSEEASSNGWHSPSQLHTQPPALAAAVSATSLALGASPLVRCLTMLELVLCCDADVGRGVGGGAGQVLALDLSPLPRLRSLTLRLFSDSAATSYSRGCELQLSGLAALTALQLLRSDGSAPPPELAGGLAATLALEAPALRRLAVEGAVMTVAHAQCGLGGVKVDEGAGGEGHPVEDGCLTDAGGCWWGLAALARCSRLEQLTLRLLPNCRPPRYSRHVAVAWIPPSLTRLELSHVNLSVLDPGAAAAATSATAGTEQGQSGEISEAPGDAGAAQPTPVQQAPAVRGGRGWGEESEQERVDEQQGELQDAPATDGLRPSLLQQGPGPTPAAPSPLLVLQGHCLAQLSHLALQFCRVDCLLAPPLAAATDLAHLSLSNCAAPGATGTAIAAAWPCLCHLSLSASLATPSPLLTPALTRATAAATAGRVTSADGCYSHQRDACALTAEDVTALGAMTGLRSLFWHAPHVRGGLERSALAAASCCTALQRLSLHCGYDNAVRPEELVSGLGGLRGLVELDVVVGHGPSRAAVVLGGGGVVEGPYGVHGIPDGDGNGNVGRFGGSGVGSGADASIGGTRAEPAVRDLARALADCLPFTLVHVRRD